MYEKAAAQFAIDVKNELGEDYSFKELLKFQMDIGILSSKGLDAYNLRSEFTERKEAQALLPKKERQGLTSISNDMAVENNCSYSHMYNIVRELF